MTTQTMIKKPVSVDKKEKTSVEKKTPVKKQKAGKNDGVKAAAVGALIDGTNIIGCANAGRMTRGSTRARIESSSCSSVVIGGPESAKVKTTVNNKATKDAAKVKKTAVKVKAPSKKKTTKDAVVQDDNCNSAELELLPDSGRFLLSCGGVLGVPGPKDQLDGTGVHDRLYPEDEGEGGYPGTCCDTRQLSEQCPGGCPRS